MIGQSSLTLRGSFFRFAFPALKDRANSRRRYASKKPPAKSASLVRLLPHSSCSFGHRIRHLSLMFLFGSSGGISLFARFDVLSHPLILLVCVLAVFLAAIFV
jgi:hypothetical protein